MSTQAETDTPSHPPYKGSVLFKDTFDGQLPATDYPKVNVSVPSRQLLLYWPSFISSQFYFVMFLIYAIFGAFWGWLCYRHMNELLPIQVSALSCLQGCLTRFPSIIFQAWSDFWLSKCLPTGVGDSLDVKSWLTNTLSAYYRYLNAHGKSTASTVFLIVGE